MAERKSNNWRWWLIGGVIVLAGWALFVGKRLTTRMNTVPEHAQALLDRETVQPEALRCPVAGGTDDLPEHVTLGLTRDAGEGLTQARRARGSFRDGELVIAGVGGSGTGRFYLEERGVGTFSWQDGQCDTVTFSPPDVDTEAP